MIPCEYIDEPHIAKTKVSGLSDNEDGIILCSFVLTQCRRVTEGQTDRRTDRRTELLYLRLRSAHALKLAIILLVNVTHKL